MQRANLDSDGTLPEVLVKTQPYGSFAYTAGNQTSGGTTSENLVSFDSTLASNRISLETTKIRVQSPGIYLFKCSVNVNASAASKEFEMWLKKNGSVVANSSVYLTLPNSGDELVTRLFMISLTSDDYIEFAWASRDDASIILEKKAAGASPTSAVTPAAVAYVVRVSQ